MENKNTQSKIMKKVYTVYALRKVQVFSVKTVISGGVLAVVASLISFADIYKNSKAAFNHGNLITYVLEAFTKTNVAVITFGIALLILIITAANDVRNVVVKRP